jgi:hypothetical protein
VIVSWFCDSAFGVLLISTLPILTAPHEQLQVFVTRGPVCRMLLEGLYNANCTVLCCATLCIVYTIGASFVRKDLHN